MNRQGDEYEVIVIGGGPGGSSAAAALAQMGRRVVLLEREKFPRYHIGESLIPHTWFPLQRIGMIDKLKASNNVRKHSVQFVNTAGEVSVPFYFAQHSEHDSSRTWQVVRSEFDQLMLDNAREKGAEVRERTLVKDMLWENGAAVGVIAEDRTTGKSYELRAPISIDATGRDSLIQSKFKWRHPDPMLKKIAVWSYYQGAKRDPGIDEGATTVAFVPDRGWFWYIPQHDNIVSVGVVADREYLFRDLMDPDEIFLREVENQPWIKDHCAIGRKMMPAKVTSDYSYRSKHCALDGVVLVGDALAFLDPVFSSGIFLALHSGVHAADAVDAALKAGDYSAGRFADYGRKMCRGIEVMRKLVYTFYDKNFTFSKLFQKYPDLKADATDCLIGNLHKDFDPLFAAMKEFAPVPEPLPYGMPCTSGVPAAI